MRTRLSKEQAASVRKFEELMTFPPDPLVIRCARCKRLRETTEISDPMLVVQPFACIELGSSCDLGETLRSNVKPTEPHYLPGSFVIATKDENHYVPGMIDYIPERHPDFESYKESPFGDERLLEGYHVSLLSNPDQDYASDWYFLHQISPLERKHNLIMPDSEALAKLETCLAMERSDLRRRLYRFSYMARTYQLKCTLPPEPRRIPIKHGAFVDPGPPVKEVFVNIVPDLSEEGNVEVTRFAATLEGAVAGTAEGEKRLSDIQRSTGYEALYLDEEDSPAPPEGY